MLYVVIINKLRKLTAFPKRRIYHQALKAKIAHIPSVWRERSQEERVRRKNIERDGLEKDEEGYRWRGCRKMLAFFLFFLYIFFYQTGNASGSL